MLILQFKYIFSDKDLAYNNKRSIDDHSLPSQTQSYVWFTFQCHLVMPLLLRRYESYHMSHIILTVSLIQCKFSLWNSFNAINERFFTFDSCIFYISMKRNISYYKRLSKWCPNKLIDCLLILKTRLILNSNSIPNLLQVI